PLRRHRPAEKHPPPRADRRQAEGAGRTGAPDAAGGVGLLPCSVRSGRSEGLDFVGWTSILFPHFRGIGLAERWPCVQKASLTMSNPKLDPTTIPPASFSFLVSTLGAQAAVALGMAPNPMTNKTEVQPELGKHAIDTLAILLEKTKGNLTSEETQL